MEFQQEMSLCPTGRGLNQEASALFRLMECTWRYGRNAEHLDVRRIAQLYQTMKGERKCLKKITHKACRAAECGGSLPIFNFTFGHICTSNV